MDDEILDIVDENDIVVGSDLRSKIYKDGLPKNRYIRYVNIFVRNKEGLLLLPKRSNNRKRAPNCYDFSCGEHVQPDEDYDDAAIRGVYEELGIKNGSLNLVGKLGPQDSVSGFMQVYEFITDKKDFNYDKDGIQSMEWHNVDKVIGMIQNNRNNFTPDLYATLKWYTKNTKYKA